MIKNKQKADETNLNAAFPSRTVDTSLAGVVSLTNTANANSGSAVTNTQRAINDTFDAVGMTGEGDATRKQYASTNYIANGDSHKAALGKLDAQAKTQANSVPTDINAIPGTVTIAKGGTGQTSKASAFDALTPATTEGDLVLRGTSVSQRLGIGTTGQVLTADLTQPGKVKWAAAPGGDLGSATGTLGIANGGTGQTTKSTAYDALNPNTTKGDIVARNATTNVRIPVGIQGQVLTVDSGSDAGVKWTESVGGAFSYLSNGDFEAGVADVQYASTTLTNGIPTGTPTLTNTPNSITLSAETTAPLRKTTSLRATAASAWTAGQGFALGPVFTVQPSDLAKNLVAQVTYQVASGSTNLQYGGKIGSQSLGIAIFDLVTASFIPIPNGALNFTTSQGSQVVQAQFQSSAVVGQQYQVFVFNLITSGGPVAVLFDERKVYPADVPSDARTVAVQGNVPGNQSIPNATNTVLQYVASIDTTRSWNGTTLTNQPTGFYYIDASFTLQNSSALGIPTQIFIFKNGVQQTFAPEPDSSSGKAGFNGTFSPTANTSTMLSLVPTDSIQIVVQNGSGTALNATYGTLNIWRIGGTAASVGDPRIITARAQVNSSTAVAANTRIPLPNIVFDRAGGFKTDGSYTIPMNGDYTFSSNSATNAGAGNFYIAKNGVNAGFLFYATTTAMGGGSTTVPCVAGDVIELRNEVAITPSLVCNLQVVRVTGPVATSAAESVNATYGLTASQAVTAASIVKYDTRTKDTHGAYAPTTGLFTVPITGQYRVSIVAIAGNQISFFVAKNGNISNGTSPYVAACTTNVIGSGSTSISAAAGDTLAVYADQAGTLSASNTRGPLNSVTFERTGN